MPAATIKSSKGTLTFTGSNDSRGNPIYRRDDGAIITKQGDKLVLSSAGKPKQSESEKLPQSSESKEALKALDQALSELERRGEFLNPNIKIDDSTMAKFMEQAEREISPYYAAIIQAKREDLTEYLSIIQLNDADTATQRFEEFDKRLEGRDASLQARGLITSGDRLKQYREETKLAERESATADRTRRSQIRDSVRQTEDYLGSKSLEGVEAPTSSRETFGTRSFVTNDRGDRSSLRTEDSPLFSLRPSIVGSLEQEKKVAVTERVGQLEEAERRKRAAEEEARLREELNSRISDLDEEE